MVIEVRQNAQAVSIHCKIFVMGGVGGKSLVLSICEVFLFKNNKFSLFLPLTIPRRCFRIDVNAAEIVCTGVYIKSYREFTQIKSSKVNNVVDGTQKLGNNLVVVNKINYFVGFNLIRNLIENIFIISKCTSEHCNHQEYKYKHKQLGLVRPYLLVLYRFVIDCTNFRAFYTQIPCV